MSLNLYNTLKQLILEIADTSKVDDAIDKHLVVSVYYAGDETVEAGWRDVEPYVRGVSLADNDVIRLWVRKGVTKTEIPGWKTFRLDRVTTWNNTFEKFDTPISDRDNTAPKYNSKGDKLMKRIFKQAQF